MPDEQGAGNGVENGQQQGQQGEPNGNPPEGQQQGSGPAQGAENGAQGQGDGKPQGEPTRKAGESDEDWKARSRTWETRSKENKTRADEATAERDRLAGVLDGLRKALDPDGSKDDDPSKIAEKAVTERDTLAAENRLLKVEKAAERAARKAGADVDSLLDSRSFLDRIAKLDPTDSAFADDVAAAVDATLKDNPRLKAQQAPASSPTGDMTGGGDKGNEGPKTIDERIAARRKRRAGPA